MYYFTYRGVPKSVLFLWFLFLVHFVMVLYTDDIMQANQIVVRVMTLSWGLLQGISSQLSMCQ